MPCNRTCSPAMTIVSPSMTLAVPTISACADTALARTGRRREWLIASFEEAVPHRAADEKRKARPLARRSMQRAAIGSLSKLTVSRCEKIDLEPTMTKHSTFQPPRLLPDRPFPPYAYVPGHTPHPTR